MSEDRTRYFARVIGPLVALIGVSVSLKTDHMNLFVPAFFQDEVGVFVTGAFTLALGLAIVAAHNRWDTLAAIIVSVFGWITTFRGALLLIAPHFVSALTADLVRFSGIVFIPAAIALVIGCYLTYVGWVAKGKS